MKHNGEKGRKISVIKRSLAFALSAFILMQQIGVQATENGTGAELSTVSSGDAVDLDENQNNSPNNTPDSTPTVSSGDVIESSDDTTNPSGGETVSSGDAVFIPYEFNSEDYEITIEPYRGAKGSPIELKLVYKGEESREEVSVVWKADTSKFAPVSQSDVSGNILSTKCYTVAVNEFATQAISADLYHKEYFMGTVVSNEIVLKRDCDAPVIEEVYYQTKAQREEVQGDSTIIWGCGDIQLEVKVTDPVNENEEEAASGVYTVWAEKNGESYPLLPDEAAGTYKGKIPMPDKTYVTFSPGIYVSDYAGNASYKGLPCFHIDKEAPKLALTLVAGVPHQDDASNQDDKPDEITGWFSEAVNGENLMIQMTSTDQSGVQKIEVSTDADFENILETITNNPNNTNNKVDVESNSFVTQTSKGTITGEQTQMYYVKAYDIWGNSTTESIQVCIDNTAPKDEVGVKFWGTEDMLVQLVDTEEGSFEYMISKEEGQIYDKGQIKLELIVEDTVVKDATSGIGAVQFDFLVKDGNGNEETFEKPIEDKRIIEDGKTRITYNLNVPSNEVFEKSFQISNLFIADAAGNKSPATITGLQDQVVYYIDNSAPRVDYAYGPNDIAGEPEGNIRYFRAPYTANITITDANLSELEVSNAAVEGNKQAQIVRVAETEEEALKREEEYQYTLSADGIYQLCVRADDILHNAFDGEEIQAVLSDSIVIDTVAPQIDIAVCNGAGEVISDYANKYFSQDMTIQMSIEELYLNTETVQVLISGVSATGEAVEITLEPDSWSADGSVYTNQYRITEEGYYTVSVSCVDKAGNSSEKATEGFYIDKTAPEVTITYDQNEPLNQYYYNVTRTATITVTDYSFDAANTQFQVKSVYGNQPVIGEWSHQPDGACDGTAHTKNCTYTVQVKFEKDDIYDFTFSCTDKAGLQSKAIAEEHFVIDKTAPVISITFDHYEVSHDYFYKKARTGFVQVDDISFDADLVTVAKSEKETVDNLPALGAFTDGGRTHTASLYFDKDGTYEFTAEATDLAGNKAEIVTCPLFILDMTAPEVVISGVGDYSANRGSVMPKVEYRDKYLYDTDSVLELSGYYHGAITGDSTKEAITDGYVVSYADFPYTQDTDDLYTLNVTIKDYAGNETTDDIVFSVNRFGSVYVLSEESKTALENYYHAEAPGITITEINVDHLEVRQVTSSCDGITTTLKEGTDYTVQKQGTEVTWKSYSYILPAENFEAEGHYAITVASTDKAKNSSDNRSKGTEIMFAVDKTAPSIVVSGMEEQGVYNTEELTVRADIKDNMSLACVAIYDGDTMVEDYDADALVENMGEISFRIGEEKGRRDIRIVALDSAGNAQEQIYGEVTVTTAVTRISDNITPLASSIPSEIEYQKPMQILWFIIPAVSALFIGTGILFLVKRRKERQ